MLPFSINPKLYTLSKAILLGLLVVTFAIGLVAWQPVVISSLPAQVVSPTVAFVRDNKLYLQRGETAFVVEDCRSGCAIYHPTWSPDGHLLAYYYRPSEPQASHEIRVVTLTGKVQRVAQGVDFFRPLAWSPQGDQLAYFISTNQFRVEAKGALHTLELWTAMVLERGVVANPTRHGTVEFASECGSGGRSESANLYEAEGGYAFGGYMAGVLAWTVDGLLLYSNSCNSHGIGRFDLATGTTLEAYPGALRSLSLNPARNSWVAINNEDQLVVGTPASLTYETVPTANAPELAFYGQVTGILFFTTLEVEGRADLFEQWQKLALDYLFSPYFEFTQPGLWSHTQSHTTLLEQGDAYAFGRVQQGMDGTLYFSRVEDSDELHRALKNGTLSADNVDGLHPTVDVLRLVPGSTHAEVWLENATQFALAPE